MKERILVLGAGFGGLELSTLLSESLGKSADVTLIDKSDHFMFGFSKLDVMFGHAESACDMHALYEIRQTWCSAGSTNNSQDRTSCEACDDRRRNHAADHLVVALARITIGRLRQA